MVAAHLALNQLACTLASETDGRTIKGVDDPEKESAQSKGQRNDE